MTADPTLVVVRNEVDRDYEYHCDALAGHVDGGIESALGGIVVHEGMTARLFEVEFADDTLFSGVSAVVAATHGDVVTETGEGMDVIASTDYYRAFGTRHRSAPVWTVQFHPEFTAALRDRLVADFDWTGTDHSFEVNAAPVFENLRSLVAERTARATARPEAAGECSARSGILLGGQPGKAARV